MNIQKALIITPSRYIYLHNLDGPKYDAFDIIKLIENKDIQDEKKSKTDVQIITDEKPKKRSLKVSYDYKVKRQKCIRALENLYRNVEENSNILIYYSGHGSTQRSNNKEDNENIDQVLNLSDGSIITDNELRKYIVGNYPTKKNIKVIVIVDSCHSGDVLDLNFQYEQINDISDRFITLRNIQTQKEKQIMLISGCTPSQSTVDGPQGGAFTRALYEVLKNPKKDRKITLLILYSLIVEKLSYLRLYFGVNQDPQIYVSFDSNVQNFLDDIFN